MTTIPQERRSAFAAAATTFHDLPTALLAARRICSNIATLEREGHTLAAMGADASLAACVRRVCATSASSRDEAQSKIYVLTRLMQIYHGRNGQAHMLMGAMIDAAVAIETEEWLKGTSTH